MKDIFDETLTTGAGGMVGVMLILAIEWVAVPLILRI